MGSENRKLHSITAKASGKIREATNTRGQGSGRKIHDHVEKKEGHGQGERASYVSPPENSAAAGFHFKRGCLRLLFSSLIISGAGIPLAYPSSSGKHRPLFASIVNASELPQGVPRLAPAASRGKRGGHEKTVQRFSRKMWERRSREEMVASCL